MTTAGMRRGLTRVLDGAVRPVAVAAMVYGVLFYVASLYLTLTWRFGETTQPGVSLLFWTLTAVNALWGALLVADGAVVVTGSRHHKLRGLVVDAAALGLIAAVQWTILPLRLVD